MLIRKEEPHDIEVISRVEYAAFKGHPMHEPGAEPTEHLVVERLREAGALIVSLVAEVDGVVVGHIAMSAASLDGVSDGWHLLGPVGVLPEYQHQGIGSALILEALRETRKVGSRGALLLGEPGFYWRFGFRSHEGLTYRDVPSQFIMGLAFWDVQPRGEVGHHEAFGRADR